MRILKHFLQRFNQHPVNAFFKRLQGILRVDRNDFLIEYFAALSTPSSGDRCTITPVGSISPAQLERQSVGKGWRRDALPGY